MPQMSGTQLAEELHESRPGMRVLFMSGSTEDAVVQQGLLEGKTNFLPKPLDPRKLLRRVAWLLVERRTRVA